MAPDGVDKEYIKEFVGFLSRLSGNDMAIVVGGGKRAREEIKLLRNEGKNEGLCDLAGIRVSRANAEELRSVLGESSVELMPESLVDAYVEFSHGKILVMGGTEPGHSTDAVAALLAELVDADLLVNASNVDGVYDKDPNKHEDAIRFKTLSASDLVGLVGRESMHAGGYALIDLTAAKIIERSGIKTVFVDGRKLENMKHALQGKKFEGTTVG